MIENLGNNTSLQHVDLSDNSIYSLGDIRSLTKLRVIMRIYFAYYDDDDDDDDDDDYDVQWFNVHLKAD